MAGTAVKIAVLMIVVASVSLDVCKACGVCDTPSIPVYHPPKAPKAPVNYPPKAPKAPKSPPLRKLPPPPSIITKPPPPPTKMCPVSLVELSVCTPILGGVVGGVVSGLLPSSKSCCALLNLLGVDLELCLCLALDANILGLISVDGKIDAVVSILTTCGYNVPPNFSCPHY